MCSSRGRAKDHGNRRNPLVSLIPPSPLESTAGAARSASPPILSPPSSPRENQVWVANGWCERVSVLLCTIPLASGTTVLSANLHPADESSSWSKFTQNNHYRTRSDLTENTRANGGRCAIGWPSLRVQACTAPQKSQACGQKCVMITVVYGCFLAIEGLRRNISLSGCRCLAAGFRQRTTACERCSVLRTRRLFYFFLRP